MKTKKNSDNLETIKIFFDPHEESEQVTFSRICKYIRQILGVTQAQIAEKLGVTADTYRFWESGRNEPSSKAAFNLCLIYLQAMQLQELNNKVHKTELLPLIDSLNLFQETSQQR